MVDSLVRQGGFLWFPGTRSRWVSGKSRSRRARREDRQDRGDPPERDRPEGEAGRPARAAHEGPRLLRARFEVLPDLPAALRHGVFAEPRAFDAYVRFSNGKGWDDRLGDAHGMAIKLLGVPGEKLLEDEKDATTQDFVLFDNPVFFIKNVADYVPFMEDFRNLKAAGLRWARSRRRSSCSFRGIICGGCCGPRAARSPTARFGSVLEHAP